MSAKRLPAGKRLHMTCDMHTLDWCLFYNPDGPESIQLFYHGDNLRDRQTKVIVSLDGVEFWEVNVYCIQELDTRLTTAVTEWKLFRWTFLSIKN